MASRLASAGPDGMPDIDAIEKPARAPAGDVYARVGERLRELRKSHGLTQAQVARIIDVSPQQYQKYEDAQTKCSLTVLIALAEHYSVDLNAILPTVKSDGVRRTPAHEVTAHKATAQEVTEQNATAKSATASEADLLARLVGAFVKLRDIDEKTRLVQLVEAIQVAHDRNM